ncbi:MAG: hypothetical protein ACOC2W_00595 [bacterium]
MNNIKYLKALIDSKDNNESMKIVTLIPYRDAPIDVNASITNRTFDDGAPVLKTFEKLGFDVLLTIDKPIKFVYDEKHKVYYTYQNNLWYKIEYYEIEHYNNITVINCG